MRYLSLIFILVMMSWTWAVIQSPTLLPEDTHIGIQEDLKRIISEYIQENVPNAKSLKFERFWTETLKENKVRATFSYSFDEVDGDVSQAARVGVSGYAILNRSKEENSEFDIWSLDELNVLNNSLHYKDGTTIRSAGSPLPPPSENKEASKSDAH